MAPQDPCHAPLGDDFMGCVVETILFEPYDFTGKHNDGPRHRHSRLRQQSPPVPLASFLLLQTVVRPILAEIREVAAVLAHEDVASAAAQRFTMRRPPFLILFLNLLHWVAVPNVRQYGFLEAEESISIVEELLGKPVGHAIRLGVVGVEPVVLMVVPSLFDSALHKRGLPTKRKVG